MKKIITEKAILYGDFVLSSGEKSRYYVDGRIITLSPEGSYLIGKIVFDLMRHLEIDAVGGPTMGADPIVTAVVFTSYLEGEPVSGFIVRDETKRHGTQKEIEGNLPRGGRVAMVDDVLTTGGSLLRAIRVVEGQGCRIAMVIVLLDRQQGGFEMLRGLGYDARVLFLRLIHVERSIMFSRFPLESSFRRAFYF